MVGPTFFFSEVPWPSLCLRFSSVRCFHPTVCINSCSNQVWVMSRRPDLYVVSGVSIKTATTPRQILIQRSLEAFGCHVEHLDRWLLKAHIIIWVPSTYLEYIQAIVRFVLCSICFTVCQVISSLLFTITFF